jgi:23S rRNA (cytidine2498-2'-O)-methyltransferase
VASRADPRGFVWVAHQVAATRWLKAEVARDAPHLRFAFARPGLTTFKAEGIEVSPATGVPSSFARAWGQSLGRAGSPAEALALLAPHLEPAPRLHVFERDLDVPVDEQDAARRGTRAAAVEAALRAAAGFLGEARARTGELVADVVVPAAGEPDEPWLVGVHRHDGARGPWPGGVPHVPPPPEAPSRAWCKLEEALGWGELAPAPGEIAVEIGAAPGGASYALLTRGLDVYGIDPGAMHPAVLGYAGPHRNRFIHLRMPAAEVPRRALPRRYQWLLLDVNLAPMIALRYAERFVALAHGGLRGAILTLKLHDDGIVADLPRLRARIATLGAAHLRVTQLPSHRHEVAAILTW